MQIDLKDKVTRVLVQEYVNKICNFETEADLNWNVHKLIHTFQVVQMAKRLIDETKTVLPTNVRKHILNAALLHDIGRCYEFKNGKRQEKIDHGKIGAALIKKYFPQMKIEAESTCFHNKFPSDKDPLDCKLVLNYVRDADMLANIDYQIRYADVWLKHILNDCSDNSKIDQEIISAIAEKRCARADKVKERNFLNMLLGQLGWYYVLKTEAGLKIAHREKLFIRFRNIVCEKMIPQIVPNQQTQKRLVRQVKEIFPDKLFV